MKPRRELAVDTAKDGLVRFLGEEYATRFVSPEARSATVAMVDEIRAPTPLEGRYEVAADLPAQVRRPGCALYTACASGLTGGHA